jgi:hypothetical protein
MRVDKSKIRTPDEEYQYLWNKIQNGGDFFSWEVHPNVLRAYNMRRDKLYKKLQQLVDSAEFKDYNPWGK